ncbi:MAG: type VI secretion system baseplate subunit TssK [Planctomycetota bacterium]|jgi:type VI secretion system protein ImpJ
MSEPLTPVHWNEGLFLRPHHLQARDAYAERLLGFHLGALAPYHYGVRTIEVDEGRLEEGTFVLRRLELILPSGEVVQVPENTRVLPRKVVEPGPGQESRMKVFLGVRRRREQAPNVSPEGLEDPDPARYVVDRQIVYDTNTGRDSQELEFNFLIGRIFFEGEPMEDFDAYPIAEIVPPEVGLPLSRLSKDYAPPCVRISVSEALHSAVRQLHAAAATKAARLSARADTEGIRSGGAVQGDVLSLWKLHTIHGYLPYLREAVDPGAAHPYPVFVELCRFAGQLASFSVGGGAPELPKYDHLDPARSYADLIPKIQGLFDELVPSNFAKLPLVQEGFRFVCDLREEWLELKNRFYVAVRSDLPETLVERWFMGTTKIACKTKIDDIVERRLRGVPTKSCERPRVLPPREGYAYFEADREAADWADVRSDRTLAIQLAAEAGMTPEALASVVVEGYVVFGG